MPVPTAGSWFGKYRLLRRLGQGGMGEVFVARQEGPGGFGRTVALKKVLTNLSTEPDFVQGFLTEAKLSAHLQHPHIVTVFDFGQEDGSGAYYLAMEYVSGRSLATILSHLKSERLRLHPALARDILVRVCDALAYAHALTDAQGRSLRLVHRDLNPSNILIGYNGQVKIIDWGIARSEWSLHRTEAGTLKGKYVYMSPEQSRGEPVDRRSDVFAAGITLYEALLGHNPFSRPNVVLSLDAIQHENAPAPGSHDPGLAVFDPIVKRALAKNPADRYPGCGELAAHLAELALPPSPETLGGVVSRLFSHELQAEQQFMRSVDASLSTATEPGGPGDDPFPPPTARRNRSRWALALALGALAGTMAMALAMRFRRSNVPAPPMTTAIPPTAAATTTPTTPPGVLSPIVPTPVTTPPTTVDPPPRPSRRAAPSIPTPPTVAAETVEVPKTPPSEPSTVQRGVLTLRPGLPWPVRAGTQRLTGGRVTVSGPGALELDDPAGPLRLRVRYTPSGSGLQLSLVAEPWAIVAVDNEARGKTPVSLVLDNRAHIWTLSHPSLATPLTLFASYAAASDAPTP